MEKEKLIRFLNNQSSQREKAEVIHWLNHPGSTRELERMMEQEWEKSEEREKDDTDFAKLLENIHHSTVGEQKADNQKMLLKPWGVVKIAASFILFFFCSYFLFQEFNSNENRLAIKDKVEVKNIVKKTGPGEKLTLIMPDNTKIILNSLSEISFTSDYGKKERLISLQGEAYFEISPDKERSFKVQTGSVVTTALGTAFNAYSRKEKIKISLTEGKVKVSNDQNNVELNPGEMAALYDVLGEDFKTGKFDTKNTIAWKEGRIHFQSKTLGEILLTLEDWYGVHFNIQGKINKSQKVTGAFNNENLDNILSGLSFSLGLEYNIDGKNVTLK